LTYPAAVFQKISEYPAAGFIFEPSGAMDFVDLQEFFSGFNNSNT
jgi:hypothetical protein